MTHRNLNGSSITFPQDNNIHFEESDHTYTVDGVGNMTPVSSVISMFFTPFDTEYWSLRKCGGNEEKAEELREKWKAKGDQRKLLAGNGKGSSGKPSFMQNFVLDAPVIFRKI